MVPYHEETIVEGGPLADGGDRASMIFFFGGSHLFYGRRSPWCMSMLKFFFLFLLIDLRS